MRLNATTINTSTAYKKKDFRVKWIKKNLGNGVSKTHIVSNLVPDIIYMIIP